MSRLGRTQVLATAAQVKRSISDQQQQNNTNAFVLSHNSAAKRSKLSSSSSAVTATATTAVNCNEIDEIENMSDTAATTNNTQKRANFSALTVGSPNNVNKLSSSLANAKPGSARKLVIKNFKSK